VKILKPMQTHDISHYLKISERFVDQVAVDADRIDADRQLPSELADELADAGFFRLLLPRALAGAELDHPDFLNILEAFAGADASTAWCLNQNNVFSTSSSRMQFETAREIWSEPRAVVTNGPPTAASKAVPATGGYRLSGHWNFSSGSDHATWIAALAPVVTDGAPNGSGSPPNMRILLMPKDQVRIVDLWQVSGLRGTGSFSFQVDDLFVPEKRTYHQEGEPWADGPLYVVPRTLLFATGFATVALGVARKSLDIAIDVAKTRTPFRSRTLLRDQQATQRAIGEAHAIHGSARTFLRQSHAAVWDSACRERSLTLDQRIQLRVAATHAIRMSAQVVDIAYNLCGAGAIFHSNPIHRRFQDIHVITQHVQGHQVHYETAGQHFVGLDPQGVF
jgi:alkylation response protein AidB-like acyl-CoA dehydrogenase